MSLLTFLRYEETAEDEIARLRQRLLSLKRQNDNEHCTKAIDVQQTINDVTLMVNEDTLSLSNYATTLTTLCSVLKGSNDEMSNILRHISLHLDRLIEVLSKELRLTYHHDYALALQSVVAVLGYIFRTPYVLYIGVYLSYLMRDHLIPRTK